jgi:pimeloyl-ACP methyl ester carboxylesterase
MTSPALQLVATSLGRMATVLHPGPAERVPLVLGHGIYLDHTMWDAIVPTLADRSVLLIDGPAHGASDAPRHTWSLDEHAHALVTVLDHYDITRAVLAGHSWGGMTALRVALRHPDRVAALGLVNTPLTRTTGSARAGFRAQQALLSITGSTRFYARRAAAALYAPATLTRHPELVKAMTERLARRRGRDLARTLRAVVMEPASVLTELGRLRMPVTVLAGASDYVLPPSTRTALTQALPTAVVTITHGRHVSPHEDPATTAQALTTLLNRAEP